MPFPLGIPLLVLHDPPGGGSSSSFADVRSQNVITRKGKTVQTGSIMNVESTLGVEGEFMKVKTIIAPMVGAVAAPMGVGTFSGVGTGTVMTPGDSLKVKVDAVMKNEHAWGSTKGDLATEVRACCGKPRPL